MTVSSNYRLVARGAWAYRRTLPMARRPALVVRGHVLGVA